MTPAQLAILKTEIQTDPLGKGFLGKSHEQIADLLRVVDRQANRDTLDPGLLVASIVRTEYAALAANDKSYVQLLAMTGSPLPLTAQLKTELGAVFPAGSTTRANLVALQKRPGTRAEELNLPHPTTSEVADALR